jgi:hypothetical protein
MANQSSLNWNDLFESSISGKDRQHALECCFILAILACHLIAQPDASKRQSKARVLESFEQLRVVVHALLELSFLLTVCPSTSGPPCRPLPVQLVNVFAQSLVETGLGILEHGAQYNDASSMAPGTASSPWTPRPGMTKEWMQAPASKSLWLSRSIAWVKKVMDLVCVMIRLEIMSMTKVDSVVTSRLHSFMDKEDRIQACILLSVDIINCLEPVRHVETSCTNGRLSQYRLSA